VILLHQVTLEEFVRRRAVERQGRRPQEYAHISRASDKVFRQPGKHNDSSVNWGSNNTNLNTNPTALKGISKNYGYYISLKRDRYKKKGR